MKIQPKKHINVFKGIMSPDTVLVRYQCQFHLQCTTHDGDKCNVKHLGMACTHTKDSTHTHTYKSCAQLYTCIICDIMGYFLQDKQTCMERIVQCKDNWIEELSSSQKSKNLKN